MCSYIRPSNDVGPWTVVVEVPAATVQYIGKLAGVVEPDPADGAFVHARAGVPNRYGPEVAS